MNQRPLKYFIFLMVILAVAGIIFWGHNRTDSQAVAQVETSCPGVEENMSLCQNSPSPQQKSEPLSIGGFTPGQPAQELKKLRMPFPLDTAGWHTFVNSKENVLCRFLLKKEAGSWRISSVMLVKGTVFPKSALLEEHQMVTGVSLKGFGTEKNLHLDDPVEVVKKLYGPPARKRAISGGEDWLYTNNTVSRRGTLIIGLRKSRVAWIQVTDY